MADRDSKGRFIRGGKDQFPQWLNLNTVVEASAGTQVEVETIVPVRISDRQVMEVLLVHWDASAGNFTTIDADRAVSTRFTITKRTKGTATTVLDDPDVIDAVIIAKELQFAEATETGGGMSQIENTIIHDFSSSGHGFLVAAQSIFMSVRGDAAVAAARSRARILYKLVTVSAEELIGLVSQ